MQIYFKPSKFNTETARLKFTALANSNINTLMDLAIRLDTVRGD